MLKKSVVLSHRFAFCVLAFLSAPFALGERGWKHLRHSQRSVRACCSQCGRDRSRDQHRALLPDAHGQQGTLHLPCSAGWPL